MDLLSCSTDLLPHNLLNIYSNIKLPSLLVSILCGIFIMFLLTCISSCVVISDHLVCKYTEFILTSSISPSSRDTSTSTLWTTESFLLWHTFLKWPNFPQLVHVFPYARHCLSACTDPTIPTWLMWRCSMRHSLCCLLFHHFYLVKPLGLCNVTKYCCLHPLCLYSLSTD